MTPGTRSTGDDHSGTFDAKERTMNTTDGYNDALGKDTASERLAAKAHDTVDQVAERAAQAEREMRDAAARTAERVREASATAEQGMRRLAAYLESNPLTCVGVAFAAGMLVSSLLRRP
jgi:ElaB/YqjD/DUF883 family membrane-anchored ribosome-binding protein